jgi:hypothetical protein
MVDTCVVARLTGRGTQNEDTGLEEPEYETVFVSKCRVQEGTTTQSDVDVAGQRFVPNTVEVHLPADLPEPVVAHDRIQITAVGSTTPARMIGRVFYVTTDQVKSQGTATRLRVEVGTA